MTQNIPLCMTKLASVNILTTKNIGTFQANDKSITKSNATITSTIMHSLLLKIQSPTSNRPFHAFCHSHWEGRYYIICTYGYLLTHLVMFLNEALESRRGSHNNITRVATPFRSPPERIALCVLTRKNQQNLSTADKRTQTHDATNTRNPRYKSPNKSVQKTVTNHTHTNCMPTQLDNTASTQYK